jgi:hypothetical protein
MEEKKEGEKGKIPSNSRGGGAVFAHKIIVKESPSSFYTA